MDKLRSTLKQLVRDWSTEVYILFYPPFLYHGFYPFFLFQGKVGACYGPIKEALLDHFKDVKPEDR